MLHLIGIDYLFSIFIEDLSKIFIINVFFAGVQEALCI